MKRFKYILLTLAVFSSFISCQQKELFFCSPIGNIPVNEIIHWDSVPSSRLMLPHNMTVHWYPLDGSLISSDMGVYGGSEWLTQNKYDVMCMDFNGNSNLAFRSNGTRMDFEVYNIRMTGTYNTNVPQLPGGEVTVAEAYPYHFYIDSRSQNINVENLLYGDTLTVHFYPKDVLREFTFLIYDVIGAKNMTRNGGAMSGMSGSYFPATGDLAATPSTILFQRVEAITEAQTSSRWTEGEKALFAAKNPNWANPDTLLGWTRDWITGQFVTFGPLDTEEHRFRLTVEAVSKTNNHYYGGWGYWYGEWENTVAAQIDSAMGKNGTLEEQFAWRRRNGGYDIVLYNDNRLIVPENGNGNGGTDGGFTVTIDDWGDPVDVPVTGQSNASLRMASMQKAAINTLATVPDFVVNGIWQDGSEWSRLFNAQYVNQPEGLSTIWNYSPKKYWYPTGEVDFYAYAPAGITNLRTGLYDNGDNTAPPVLEYAMPYKDGREEPPPGTGEPNPAPVVDDIQDDLLVAVQNRTSPQTIPVPMNFRHAFSRVSVKAKIRDNDYSDGYRIKVTRIDLRNLYTKGELELNKDDGITISNGIPNGEPPYEYFRYNGTVTLWTNLDSLANYRFKLLSTTVAADDDYTPLIHSDDEVFVMPQQIVAANYTALYVEYNIYTYSATKGEQYVTSATKLIELDPNFAFEIGKYYMLLIELEV